LSDLLSHRLALLAEQTNLPLLSQCLHGIERECLRVDANGQLAHSPHPRALGSALTHPQITTDYSEALLEFITGTDQDPRNTLAELETIHRFTYAKLDGEFLWSPSTALSAAGRGGHSHRRIRQLQRRPAQARLPPGPGAALRQDHAVHRRHPLQLLAARAAVGGAAGRRRRSAQRAGLSLQSLHQPDPQLPSPQLAVDCTCSAPRQRWMPASCVAARTSSNRSTSTRSTCPGRPACA